ncbi:MAG: 50S ribosomal protein L32, partial [Amylibacter sp.]|nr:50S ribosomal protein L32 [Amylibacter sp.]
PHHVCGACGHYADREVVAVVEDIDIDEDAA